MITDNGLRLATAEVVASHGSTASTLSEDSVALGLDPGGLTEFLRNYSDIGAGQRLMININVDTTFTATNVAFPETMEFQIVSLPMVATVLDTATTIGKDLFIASVVTDEADADPDLNDTFIVVGHGLPLGAPIFLSSLVTTTVIADDVIYYVIPTTADRFQVATTLANALTGTNIVFGTGNGTATVNFVPTVHGSSGGLAMFDDPSDISPLQAGRQIQFPLRPLPGPTPKLLPPTSQATVPVVDELKEPLGAGPGADLIAANAQRFYYLLYKASAAITAGTVTVDMVIDAGDDRKSYGSGFEVI